MVESLRTQCVELSMDTPCPVNTLCAGRFYGSFPTSEAYILSKFCMGYSWCLSNYDHYTKTILTTVYKIYYQN